MSTERNAELLDRDGDAELRAEFRPDGTLVIAVWENACESEEDALFLPPTALPALRALLDAQAPPPLQFICGTCGALGEGSGEDHACILPPALVNAAEAFANVAERAVAAHRAPKTGMQVPYFDDFAHIPPSVASRLEWWAKRFREALAQVRP